MNPRSGCHSHHTILQSIDFSLRSCKVDKVLEDWPCASCDHIGIGGREHCIESVVLLAATGLESLAWSACYAHYLSTARLTLPVRAWEVMLMESGEF